MFFLVLITGGFRSGEQRSAEIFNPVTKTGCTLPQLPEGEGRSSHSQDGGLLCGGNSPTALNTCVKWSPASGTWTKSHSLKQRRRHHVSWATASGVYLIGSDFSNIRSEKVKMDGSVEESFGLKHRTRLNCAFNLTANNLFLTVRRALSQTMTNKRSSSLEDGSPG